MWSNIPMKNLIAFLFLGTALPLFAQPYKFQVIEPFLPDALNDEGVVVGHIGAPVQGVFRFNEFVTNVNDPSVSGGQTALNGVNDHGDIVGNLPNGTGYLLKNGITTPIVFPGAASTFISGINNAGTIVGFTSTGSFVLKDGVFATIRFPADAYFGYVNGINNSGQ